DYRLVSFDRGKRFRDTTRVTVPAQGQSIAKLYVVPAIAALVAGGSQQFYVYGRTDGGDSVAVAATLQSSPGGVASGLLYTAGDTAGEYTLTFKRQAGGSESTTASVAISAGKDKTPTSEPTPEDPPQVSPESDPTPAPAPESTPEPTPTLTPLPPTSGPSPAELPRVHMDTRYQAPGGRTIVVPGGGDLQAAITAAARGDIIELASGAVFTGNFVLPAKPGSGQIVIRSATSLPAEGTRVTPSRAAGYARIVTPNSMPALRTANSPDASDYRLMGVEITSSAPMTYAIVHIGDYDHASTSVDQLPRNIVFDRVWVHG